MITPGEFYSLSCQIELANPPPLVAGMHGLAKICLANKKMNSKMGEEHIL
jgi:hypothetical protein